jgi:beta-glucanase (GH16 family)
MFRRTIIASTLAAALALLAAGSASASWQLAFQDYFTGTSLNTAQWRTYGGTGFRGNGVRRAAQVTVSNGRLVITARMINGVLNSGGVWNPHDYKYGKFVARVRTDVDPSAATSGVVLTWPQSGNMYVDGENDFYETGAYTTRRPFYGFIHFPGGQFSLLHDADASQWHTMVMEWSPSYMSIYRDGTLARRITDTSRIPDSYHHLAMAIDALKSSMSGTVRMYVEYAQIYRRVVP